MHWLRWSVWSYTFVVGQVKLVVFVDERLAIASRALHSQSQQLASTDCDSYDFIMSHLPRPLSRFVSVTFATFGGAIVSFVGGSSQEVIGEASR